MGQSGADLVLGLTVVVIAGGMGLASARVVRAVGQAPAAMLGWRDSAGDLLWRLAMVGLLALAVRVGASGPESSLTGWWTTSWHPTVSAATGMGLLAVCYGVAALWPRLPVLNRANAAVAGSYGTQFTPLSAGELALVLGVRYPVTVLVEETVFRGWLQHELGFGVVLASVCFAAYHLVQWRTIPSLVPYCLAGGVIVAMTGTLWVAAVVHYGSDAVFALRTESGARRESVGRNPIEITAE